MTFRHWAGVSSYTSVYTLAETCVLDKQLLGPLFCGQLSLAPLIPKLRGHFAEFLNKGYPVHLMILSSSTCVGLRYGHLVLSSSFSRQCEFMDFVTIFHSSSSPRVCYKCTSLFVTPHDLNTTFHLRASTILLCHRFSSLSIFGSTGMSTSCASPTPFDLGLAPD